MQCNKKKCNEKAFGIGANSGIYLAILAKSSMLVAGLVIFLGKPSLAIADSPVATLAQIIPDTTLGNENSVIIPNVNINGTNADQINGGAIRDSNLFHSFREFNVGDGQRVYFANPSGINNILSRVTGNNPSNILGTLGVNGNANLFLINPNGIIFGKNARLDLAGSFVTSTANAVQFVDGTQFIAGGDSSPTNPILTITAPIGLQFGDNPGAIRVDGNGQGHRSNADLLDTDAALQVAPNQTLALVGGNLSLAGGTLKTAGGRIELGSVTSSGLVNLTPIDTGFALGYAGISTFGDIQLVGGSVVDTSGIGGGDIQVQGRRITLQEGSQLDSSTLGSDAAGVLNVTATESIELIGATPERDWFSGFRALVYPEATGVGSNINVQTERLILQDAAEITTGNFGEGKGGNIILQARQLSVQGGSQILANTFSQGNAGNLQISARDWLEVVGTSTDNQLVSLLITSSEPNATGNGGDLTIETGKLIVGDGAGIVSGTFGDGNAGRLNILAHESIEVIGTTRDGLASSVLATSVFSGATGDGSDLKLETGRLTVRDGGQIQAAIFGQGKAGNLNIIARESVEILGSSFDGQLPSALGTSVEENAIGDGGDLRIETGKLIINGSQITSATRGKGNAGDVTIIARDFVEVIGGAVSSSVNTGATGDGGDLTIKTGRLTVTDGGQVLANTFGNGDAGKLLIVARESVEVIGTTPDGKFKSGLFTSVNQGATGDGGDLDLQTGRLIVQDGATIRSGTFAQGAAGNMQISADSVKLDNQASITSTARSGNGGNMVMQIQYLLLLRRHSQISATAGTDQAEGNGGNITINIPDGFIVAFPQENSDITANAFQGSGGKVNINATGVFGIKPLSRSQLEQLLQTSDPTKLSPSQLQTSDITAISQSNASLNGDVNLNILDSDPSQGLQELPTDIVDVSGLINQNLCAVSQGSEFIVTGRGGLPASPYEVFSADTGWEDWWIAPSPKPSTRQSTVINNQPNRKITNGNTPHNSTRKVASEARNIIEAQGWIKDASGKVFLIANPVKTTPKGTWLHPQDCHLILDF